MIGRLSGTVEAQSADSVILDVGGVGYLVYAPRRVLESLPQGGRATLWIETHVREDHIHLYGFAATAERDWFRLLTTVQGVGVKAALAILGVLGIDELALAIAAQDRAPITRADGVGPKLAGRIVAELKEKAGLVTSSDPVTVPAGGGAVSAPAGGPVREDAISALVNLGYGRAQAFAAVHKVAREGDRGDDLGALIAACLKELSP